ncbi:MAG TPA: hypothetical protein VFV27_12165 [Nevskiaceae bacterium]|nr:hypothetical protein [Nevskiaceae bacterium]
MDAAAFEQPFDMHLFSAVARSADPARSHQPQGQRHPLLLFLRQPPGQDHDFDRAAALVAAAGWDEVDFTRAAVLPADAAEQPVEPYHGCYLDAVRLGHGLLVYATPVQVAPRKGS